MNKAKTKEYDNGELTVVWTPSKCIHSGVCVKMLPDVYKPGERPWVKVENATTGELKKQIEKCPSGALSYYMNGEQEKETAKSTSMNTKVDIIENGPMIVHGTLQVKGADGKAEEKQNATAFCRCGQSGNKPYCDGSHTGAGFKG